jgi:hypothetical protein
MYAVVNHMKLSRPLDNNIIGRMNSELMSNISKMPGVVDALCVQVADDGIVIIVVCESEESLERVHQEVGSPWVGENLTPYLAGTDRKVGPVIARPQNRSVSHGRGKMAVIMIHDLPGMNLEMIDGVRQAGVFDQMRSAPGFQGHWSGQTETGYRVIELWDSREAWQDWYNGTIKPNLPHGVQLTQPTFIDLNVEVRPG